MVLMKSIRSDSGGFDLLLLSTPEWYLKSCFILRIFPTSGCVCLTISELNLHQKPLKDWFVLKIEITIICSSALYHSCLFFSSSGLGPTLGGPHDYWLSWVGVLVADLDPSNGTGADEPLEMRIEGRVSDRDRRAGWMWTAPPTLSLIIAGGSFPAGSAGRWLRPTDGTER